MALEYMQLKITEGKADQLNLLAKEGWSIVSGSVIGSAYLTVVMLQRELPAKRGRKPSVGPEETKEE